MYKVVPLKDLNQDAWNDFVNSSDEAWLWHRTELISALSTWTGRSDASFAILDNSTNEIMLICPLQRVSRKKFGLFSLQTLNSLGGPAIKAGLGEKHIERIREALLAALGDLSKQINAAQIDLALAPMAPAYRGDDCPKVNPLLHLGALNTLTQVYVVDLRKGTEKIWQGFEKRARTAVRKAERLKVTVREANHSVDLQKYYELHKITYLRTGATPHPFAYFEGIWDHFYAKGLAHILIAEVEGEVVAAETFSMFKGAAAYWTGASNETGLATNANSLLQWTAMQNFIKIGLQFYETGEAFPNAVGGKQKGLDYFKRSFGGSLYPFFRGRIISHKGIYSIYHLWEAIRKS